MKPLKKEQVTLELSEIIPYERNNKIHKEKDINEVIKSIQKNWYIAPIIVDEKNVILAWHGRTLALQKMGIESIEVVRVYGLSEKQKRDYRIRDNTTTLLAEFDLENLKIELDALWDFSADIMGHLDFDIWINLWGEEKTFDETIEDDVPEIEEKIFVQVWDLYQLWNHYLMCGSSTDGKEVKTLLRWEKVHMVLTDPPYLMNYEWSIWRWGKKSNKHNHKKIENDNLKWEEGQIFLQEFLKQIKENCKGSYYIFFYRLWIDKIFRAMDDQKMKWRNLIIWKKNHFNLSPTDYKSIYEPIVNGWADDYQPIFYGWTEDHNFYWKKWEIDVIDDIQVSSVLENQKTLKNDLHPTMKPISLLEKILNNSTKENETVLDLFGGSGSTLIACEKKSRVCYMMELSPEYVQVIIKRFSQVTGWTQEVKCLNRDFDFTL